MDDLITRNGQMQWAGLLLGETTPFVGVQLTGWDDLPDVESGTVTRPAQHGAWAGPLLAGTRTLTWDFRILPHRADQFPELLDRLRRATALRQEEQPLVVQLAGFRRVMWARITKRALAADRTYTRGEPVGSLVWEAADPRRYEVTQQVARTGPREAGPGLGWPLAWPTEWEGSGTGVVEAENEGDADTFPLIEFRGPVRRPALIDTGTGRCLEYGLALGAGDVLSVDTASGTVLFNGLDSRLDAATPRSVPEQAFTLEPETKHRFLFTAEPGPVDSRASVSIVWRSAYW